ncbi:MAG TPA: DUF308 domain-containing protein [Polyangiaceae bacterium]|jgi:uncharacterized membrane protein HdeD (DUF308 family)|nr:DUF308 domain-containing protein [Polyangiaceae bacterium]
MLDPSVAIQASSRSSWWAIVLRGVLACIFGVIVLANPRIGIAALILMFAVYAAVDGVAALATAISHGRAGLSWGWWLVEGLVSLGIAALALARPGITLLAVVLLVAFRAILLGLVELGGALGGKEHDHRWLLGVTGVVSLLFGILLIANPLAGGIALVWVIGVYAVVFGVMLIVVGLRALGTHHGPDVSGRQYAT